MPSLSLDQLLALSSDGTTEKTKITTLEETNIKLSNLTPQRKECFPIIQKLLDDNPKKDVFFDH
jgi:hypothetical protein